VADLVVEGRQGPSRLGARYINRPLSGDMDTKLIQRSKHQHWIQNQQSRIPILTTSESVKASNPSSEKGTVAIAITEPIRIRILVEDVDTYHERAEQFESYISTLMANDLFHPVKVGAATLA
jgi:hypothetical protein